MESSQQSNVDLNKESVRRAIAEGWNKNDWSQVALACAPDVIAHPPIDQEPVVGLESFEKLFHMIRAPFSDFRLEILQLFGEGEHVSALYRQTGTHDGPLMGMPPTGKSVSIMHLIDYRFENGRLAEFWSMPDLLGMMDQLGLGPPKAMMAVMKVVGKVRGVFKR